MRDVLISLRYKGPLAVLPTHKPSYTHLVHPLVLAQLAVKGPLLQRAQLELQTHGVVSSGRRLHTATRKAHGP